MKGFGFTYKVYGYRKVISPGGRKFPKRGIFSLNFSTRGWTRGKEVTLCVTFQIGGLIGVMALTFFRALNSVLHLLWQASQ